MKTHKGIRKRFKKTGAKRGKLKLTRQRRGRGSKHLKSKQSNSRKRRIRQVGNAVITQNLERAVRTF